MSIKIPVRKSAPILDFSKFFSSKITAFTTLRPMDFKLKEGARSLNRRQKKFLKEKLGISCDNFPVVRQVHGRRIIVIKRPSCLKSFLGKADGFIANRENIPLSVRTADCLSIFLFDPKTKAIGLVHAGWKGSRKKIVQSTIRLMKKKWRTNPKDLRVVFGPAIQKCCYEVGKEFKRMFSKEAALLFRRRRNKTQGRLYLDLPLINKHQLIGAGVKRGNIFDCKICTTCDSRLFSFRREGEKAGRMLSLMMLKS